ncbi:hypothetical protein ABLT15_34650, partial [Paraburkholderia tropica]|uniref:hypothetical protein n=1 Tax=Paraburkholderia tropica TaxID=92647 RepID=UPI0032B5961A
DEILRISWISNPIRFAIRHVTNKVNIKYAHYSGLPPTQTYASPLLPWTPTICCVERGGDRRA